MDKIKMTTPLVEMDGDEMTRILWKMIKDELLEPFIDLDIASYYVELGGCDIICFTAGLGENASEARLAIMEKLTPLGIKIDLEKNQIRGEEVKISTNDSSVVCYVVPTNEELMIAEDTLSLIGE